jgi:integrase/polyhydroxyalkanoate synthesis regulator phasin
MGGMAYMCKNRHGTYYARFIIPKHLQSHFNNKKEIRRSLQTDSRKLAVKRARVYRVQFESIVDQLMSNTDNTSEQAKRILDSLFADKAKLQEEVTEQFAKRMRNNATKFNDDLSKTQLITFVDLNGNPVAIDQSNAEEERRTLETYFSMQVSRQVDAPEHQPTSKKITEYLDDYIAHKLTSGKKGSWSEGTARQKPNKLNVFRSVFGDKPAAELARNDMDDYIDIAYKIPSNFENPIYKKFKGITLNMVLTNAPEIEAIDYGVRGAGTVRDDLKTIRAFLNWVLKRKDEISLQNAINALDNEISDIDYESSRRAFTDEELKTLLQDDNTASENYVKGFSNPINFWLPFIALYTGARIAEICQLHVDDIKQVKALSSDTEHLCIDINDDDDKKLKTKHSKRQIPIHQNLINSGLITYVDNLKSKRETKLFPDAARASDQFGGQSQWFGI